MSVVENLAEILSRQIDRENIHLSGIKEDDYPIALLYLLGDVLELEELTEFANLLLNMKTAKRVRNDLLKLARSISIRIAFNSSLVASV